MGRTQKDTKLMYFLTGKKNKPGDLYHPTSQPYQWKVAEKPQMYKYRDTVVNSMHLEAR